jgi:hypothetical protein
MAGIGLMLLVPGVVAIVLLVRAAKKGPPTGP